MGWDAVSESSSGFEREVSGSIRAGVKAFVSTGERVLLVHEQHSDGESFWTLPGGGLEPGEVPVEALQRELQEELECDILVGDARGSFWYAHRSGARSVTSYRVYECDIVSRPRPVLGEGVLEARWVPRDAVPPQTLPQVRWLCR